MSEDVLNRTSAPQILRFFDVCFKQGVIDAGNYGDDLSVREFLESHREDWTFGALGEEEGCDWKWYRFILYRWARASHQANFAEDYIYQIKRVNYLWCFLPFCMRFYLMGLEEWLAYPVYSSLDRFKLEMRRHWNPNLPVKKITPMDTISYMHEFAHQYRNAPEGAKLLSPFTMDGFCQAVYNLTRAFTRKDSYVEEDFTP